MRRIHQVVSLGVFLTAVVALGHPAAADRISASTQRPYPDIASGMNGVVRYHYDPARRKGVFLLTNTPFLLTDGPSDADEYAVQPNDDGIRRQVLKIALDRNGGLIADPGNSYELYGTVISGGEVLSGLLLKGVPVTFGVRNEGSPAGDKESFDLSMKITGGQLASKLGEAAFLRIKPERPGGFAGMFDRDFSAVQVASNTQPIPARGFRPIPRKVATALCLVGGAGVLWWSWRRYGHRVRGRAAPDARHRSDSRMALHLS